MVVDSSDNGASQSRSQSQSQSPDDSGDQETGDMGELSEFGGKADAPPLTGNGQTKSANAKDPMRPRRKKARRACYACQRAHLTCGLYPDPLYQKKKRWWKSKRNPNPNSDAV